MLMTNEEQKKELKQLTIGADSGIPDDHRTEEIAKFLANPSSIATENNSEFIGLANIVCNYTINQSKKNYLNMYEGMEFIQYVAALHDLTSKKETQYLSDTAGENWEKNKERLLQRSLLLIKGMLDKYTEESAQEKANQRAANKSFLQNFSKLVKASPSSILVHTPFADKQEKLINIQKKLTAALQQIPPVTTSVPVTKTIVEPDVVPAIQPAPEEAAPKPTTKTFWQKFTDMFRSLYTRLSSPTKSKTTNQEVSTSAVSTSRTTALSTEPHHSSTAEIERVMPAANEQTMPIQAAITAAGQDIHKARPTDVAGDTKKITKDAHREITYYLLSIATEKSRGKSVEPIDIGPIVKNLLDKRVIDDPFSRLSKNPYDKIIIRDQTTRKIYNIESGGSASWMKCKEMTIGSHLPELQRSKSSAFPKEIGTLKEYHVRINDSSAAKSTEAPIVKTPN